jgi:NAD(P) transhydrogenase subunit alpha
MAEEKTIVIGVLKETFPGETRVGLIPAVVANLKRIGGEVIIEPGAGFESGFTDDEYTSKGATVASRDDVFAKADVIVQVRAYGANPEAGKDDLAKFR